MVHTFNDFVYLHTYITPYPLQILVLMITVVVNSCALQVEPANAIPDITSMMTAIPA